VRAQGFQLIVGWYTRFQYTSKTGSLLILIQSHVGFLSHVEGELNHENLMWYVYVKSLAYEIVTLITHLLERYFIRATSFRSSAN